MLKIQDLRRDEKSFVRKDWFQVSDIRQISIYLETLCHVPVHVSQSREWNIRARSYVLARSSRAKSLIIVKIGNGVGDPHESHDPLNLLKRGAMFSK